MKKSGQITVFLSLMLISVCAFLCCILESARTAGARCYLQLAADSAMESLMSQYHRGLWDNYRLLLLDGGVEGDSLQLGTISKQLEQYMEYYLEPSKDLILAKGNFYPMKLEVMGIESVERVTDKKGQSLETQVLSYMKYKAPDIVLEQFFEQYNQQKGAEQAADIAGSYSAHTKEALKLEDKIARIQNSLLEQQERFDELLLLYERIGDTLSKLKEQLDRVGEEHEEPGPWDDDDEEDNWDYIYYLRAQINKDVKSYLSKSAELQKDVKNSKQFILDYRNDAQKFSENLKQTEALLTEKEEDVSKEMFPVLMQESKQYDAYVRQTGERYLAVCKAEEKLLHNLEVLGKADEIKQLSEVEINKGNVDGMLSSYRDWFNELKQYENTSITKPQKPDKEKLKLIEQVQKLAGDGLLSLVMNGKEISDGKITGGRLPSSMVAGFDKTQKTGIEELGTNFITNEYFLQFLTNVISDEKKEFQYEVEYLIGTKSTDRENLLTTIGQILVIREGMNLMYLLTDGAKRSEAESLATIIVGGTGIYPLVLMTAFLILTVWALGEALVDVRSLLDNKRVPMIKNQENWQLGLEGLLSLGKDSKIKSASDIEHGITYEAYLRILLVKRDKVTKYFRAMDIMQINIQRNETNFYMDQCLYQLELLGKVRSKHVFFSIGFVKSLMGTPERIYQNQVKAIKAY